MKNSGEVESAYSTSLRCGRWLICVASIIPILAASSRSSGGPGGRIPTP